MNNLINDIKYLKEIIVKQNSSIELINSENKILKDELKKITKLLEESKASSKNVFNPPFPPLPSSSTSSNLINSNAPKGASSNNSRPLFSQITAENNEQSILATPNSQGTKRARVTQNHTEHLAPKVASKSQLKLKTFNSFDPNSQNKVITLVKDDGFIVAGNKNNKNKKSNMKKQFSTQNYAQSIGRDQSNLLSGKPKQFYIYLGKLDESAKLETVKKYLDVKLKSVKFDDNNIRDVVYDNVKELNTENPGRSYKSFSFSVNYLDKDIIKLKSLWPMYSIVNKYKLSHAEWTTISEKFKKSSLNRATEQSSSLNVQYE